MARIIGEKVRRDEGEDFEILIEVEDESLRRASLNDIYGETRGVTDLIGQPFEKGMELIRACAEQVAATVEKVSQSARPSEVEVELGIKFDGEVGALISKTGIEAHLQVTLKWSRKETA